MTCLLLAVAGLLAGACGGSEEAPPPLDRGLTSTTPGRTAAPAPARPPAPSATPSSPEEEAVVDALQRYATAVREGDETTLCRDVLSSASLEAIERLGADCERDFIPAGVGAEPKPYRLEVLSLRVEGDRAEAAVRVTMAGGEIREETQPLVREEGEWRIPLPNAGG